MESPCSRCRGPRDRKGQSYCRACHAAYMRENRPAHAELPPEERRKSNARAYANTYRRRGKLERGPCEVCGDPQSEMHHDDYSKPLEVRWLCRPCHIAHHEKERVVDGSAFT